MEGHPKFFILTFVIMVIILGLSGCATQTPQIAPPSISSTPEPEEGDTELFGKYPEASKAIKEAKRLCEQASFHWQQGDTKSALSELDKAYSILLTIDPKKYPDLAQPLEDLRFTIAKRILQVQTSKARGTKGIASPIPLTINRHVKEALDNFQGPLRDFFMRSYQRSLKYRPMIVQKLKDAGLPEELSWLPLIESGFNVRAFSPAKALGMWQFIASTGHKYGLKRDDWIDERMDPEKSTDAAIMYLKELHGLFGDWTTALAAYNCGEGNVLRVIRTQKIDYLDNFWDLYEKLPRETAFYVPQFIAVLHIINSPKTYNFELPSYGDKYEYETVEINKNISLNNLESACNFEEGVLVNLNPELRKYMTPPYSYQLKIPKGKKDIVLAAIQNITEYSEFASLQKNGKKSNGDAKALSNKKKSSSNIHVVKKGETLNSIAQQYNCDTNTLKKINGLKSESVRVGQGIKLPSKQVAQKQQINTPHTKYAQSSQTKGTTKITYKVKKGDSLYSISKKFGVSLSELMELNGLKDKSVYPGQVLIVKITG